MNRMGWYRDFWHRLRYTRRGYIHHDEQNGVVPSGTETFGTDTPRVFYEENRVPRREGVIGVPADDRYRCWVFFPKTMLGMLPTYLAHGAEAPERQFGALRRSALACAMNVEK